MFDEIMKTVMVKSPQAKSQPIFIVRDQPEVDHEHKFYCKKMEAFRQRKIKIDEEMEVARKEYWTDLEVKLIHRGFMTQKEVDAGVGLSFHDGVLFKQIQETKG